MFYRIHQFVSWSQTFFSGYAFWQSQCKDLNSKCLFLSVTKISTFSQVMLDCDDGVKCNTNNVVVSFLLAGSVSSSSTLRIFREANHLWWLLCPPVYLLGYFPCLHPTKQLITNRPPDHSLNFWPPNNGRWHRWRIFGRRVPPWSKLQFIGKRIRHGGLVHFPRLVIESRYKEQL